MVRHSAVQKIKFKLLTYCGHHNAEFDFLLSAEKEMYLATKVNHVGVWVIEGQKHSIAGVQLIDSHGLVHALLEGKKTT